MISLTKSITAIFFIGLLLAFVPAHAESSMSNKRIDELLSRLEIEIQGQDGLWRFYLNDVEVTIITDENADRMRIIAPVAKTENLNAVEYERVLQANFDTALDARYAIAKSILWSVFIHPLGVLSDRQLIEGIGQVVNLVSTFGTSYHSGSAVFGGGDSQGIEERELIENLIERGLAI
jgi:hypothetical protein